jgi:hypothetical protein|nr:MAG TPA: hypothetical protein [Caudoviricetes sp.]
MKIKFTLTPAELSAVKAVVHYGKQKLQSLKDALKVFVGKFGKSSIGKEVEVIRNEAVFNIEESEVNGNYEVEFSFAETYTLHSLDLCNRIFDAYIGLFEAVVPAFGMFAAKMFPLMEEAHSLDKEAVRVRPTVYSDGSPMPVASRVKVDFSAPYEGFTFIEQYRGQNVVVRPDMVDSIRSEYSTEDGFTHIIVEKGNNIIAGVVSTDMYTMYKNGEPVTLLIREARDPRASDLTKSTVERLVGSGAVRYSLFDNK